MRQLVQIELVKLINNLTTRMTMSHRCSAKEDDATQMMELMREIKLLINNFSLLEFIWFGKKLNLPGLKKRVRKARGEFDAIVEKIMKFREEERSRKRDGNAGGNTMTMTMTMKMTDFLDILPDIMEDEKEETRLTRENVKAMILVTNSHFTDPLIYTQMFHIHCLNCGYHGF